MHSFFFRIKANCPYSAHTIPSWKSPLYSSCQVSTNHGPSGRACKSGSSCWLIGLEDSHNEFASRLYLMFTVFQSSVLLTNLGAGSWRQIQPDQSLVFVYSTPGASHPQGRCRQESTPVFYSGKLKESFPFPRYSYFPKVTAWDRSKPNCHCLWLMCISFLNASLSYLIIKAVGMLMLL